MKLEFVRRRLVFAAVLAAMVSLAACGGGTDSSSDAPASPATPTEASNGSQNGQVSDEEVLARGERLFKTEGCSACHRTNRERLVGPGLAGIRDRGDDTYIRQSIREPGEVIVDGFPNVMTGYAGLESHKMDDLIAYLKTLD